MADVVFWIKDGNIVLNSTLDSFCIGDGCCGCDLHTHHYCPYGCYACTYGACVICPEQTCADPAFLWDPECCGCTHCDEHAGYHLTDYYCGHETLCIADCPEPIPIGTICSLGTIWNTNCCICIQCPNAGEFDPVHEYWTADCVINHCAEGQGGFPTCSGSLVFDTVTCTCQPCPPGEHVCVWAGVNICLPDCPSGTCGPTEYWDVICCQCLPRGDPPSDPCPDGWYWDPVENKWKCPDIPDPCDWPCLPGEYETGSFKPYCCASCGILPSCYYWANPGVDCSLAQCYEGAPGFPECSPGYEWNAFADPCILPACTCTPCTNTPDPGYHFTDHCNTGPCIEGESPYPNCSPGYYWSSVPDCNCIPYVSPPSCDPPHIFIEHCTCGCPLPHATCSWDEYWDEDTCMCKPIGCASGQWECPEACPNCIPGTCIGPAGTGGCIEYTCPDPDHTWEPCCCCCMDKDREPIECIPLSAGFDSVIKPMLKTVEPVEVKKPERPTKPIKPVPKALSEEQKIKILEVCSKCTAYDPSKLMCLISENNIYAFRKCPIDQWSCLS